MSRKRPLFATVICAVTALFLINRLLLMLPAQEPHVTTQLTQIGGDTRLFFHAMTWIEVILSISGIITLWMMHPSASIIYASKIITSIINGMIGIFVLHIVQFDREIFISSSKAFSHSTMPIWAASALPIMGIVLAIGFQVALFLYVWRVTYLLPRQTWSQRKYA
jgi:hypothetical protein